MREYNYNVQYLKGKDNYVADHLSRSVRIVVRPPEAFWLGITKCSSKKDSEKNQFGVEYLDGSQIGIFTEKHPSHLDKH